MTLREVDTILKTLPEIVITEKAWDLQIHGGKGDEYRETALMELHADDENEEFDAEINKFVEGLHGRHK